MIVYYLLGIVVISGACLTIGSLLQLNHPRERPGRPPSPKRKPQ